MNNISDEALSKIVQQVVMDNLMNSDRASRTSHASCTACGVNGEYGVFDSGLAEITCNGRTVRLEPGVLAYFPSGAVCCWNVIQPVTKYFR